MANFMGKVAGFVIAFRDWKAAGYPTRSPAWVKELFETHCNPPDGPPCEYYDPDGKNPFTIIGKCPPGLCRKCGCHVSDDPDNEVNALRYPTKACPAGKFEAIVEVEKRPEQKGPSTDVSKDS